MVLICPQELPPAGCERAAALATARERLAIMERLIERGDPGIELLRGLIIEEISKIDDVLRLDQTSELITAAIQGIATTENAIADSDGKVTRIKGDR